MSIKFVCLYGNADDRVSIRRDQMARLPAIVTNHQGGVDFLKLEVRKNALLKHRVSTGEIRNLADLNLFNFLDGVDVSTKDGRYYFAVSPEQKLSVRRLTNGNTELLVKRQKEQNNSGKTEVVKDENSFV